MTQLPELTYLLTTSGWNRVRRIRAKLRSRSYSAALLAGLAYFILLLGPMFFGPDQSIAPEFARIVVGFAPFLLAVLTGWWWLWGGHKDALGLTPAEAQILVPAPISRQDLIRYRIMKAQVSIIGASVFFGLLIQTSPIPTPLRMIGVWTVLSTLHPHQAASSLVHVSAEQQGLSGLRRNAVALTIFGVAFAGLLWLVISAALELQATATLGDLRSVFAATAERPLAIALFLPFNLLLDPLSAPEVGAWATAWLPAFLILVLHYIWVIRTDAAFEEGAVEAGRRRAERVAAIRTGRRAVLFGARMKGDRPPFFPLAPVGRPGIAILWKYLVGFTRQAQTGSMVGMSLIFVAFFAFLTMLLESSAKAADASGLILVVTASMLTLFGSMGIRNDLREDRHRIDLLRSYPLSGPAVVGAQIASSALSVTLMQVLMMATGTLLLLFGEIAVGYWRWIVPGLLGSWLLLPALNGLAMAAQNAALLFFPDWVPEHVQGSGVEGLGQQMLSILASTTALVLGMLVPVFAAGTILLRAGFSPASGIFAAVAALVILWSEVILVVILLGDAFMDLDPPEARR